MLFYLELLKTTRKLAMIGRVGGTIQGHRHSTAAVSQEICLEGPYTIKILCLYTTMTTAEVLKP